MVSSKCLRILFEKLK